MIWLLSMVEIEFERITRIGDVARSYGNLKLNLRECGGSIISLEGKVKMKMKINKGIYLLAGSGSEYGSSSFFSFF